jgi:hypothetical protein
MTIPNGTRVPTFPPSKSSKAELKRYLAQPTLAGFSRRKLLSSKELSSTSLFLEGAQNAPAQRDGHGCFRPITRIKTGSKPEAFRKRKRKRSSQKNCIPLEESDFFRPGGASDQKKSAALQDSEAQFTA